MPFINVKKSFRHAIGGNIVVEYAVGVHEVEDEVATIAVEHLKVAEIAKDEKGALPKITRDIHGNLLPNAIEPDESAE